MDYLLYLQFTSLKLLSEASLRSAFRIVFIPTSVSAMRKFTAFKILRLSTQAMVRLLYWMKFLTLNQESHEIEDLAEKAPMH
jgi:hypothetical protein